MTIQLIERLIAGARESKIREEDFRRLYELYARRVWISFPRGTAPEERDELTQETFIAVYKGMSGCRAPAFESWLHRIAKNTFLSWVQFKGRQKRSGPEVSLEDLLDRSEKAPEAEASTVLNGMVEKEHRKRLHQAIEALPDQQRRCVVLRVVQERSVQEIAMVLGLAQGTVKAHLHQAKQSLKLRLNDVLDVDFDSRGL